MAQHGRCMSHRRTRKPAATIASRIPGTHKSCTTLLNKSINATIMPALSPYCITRLVRPGLQFDVADHPLRGYCIFSLPTRGRVRFVTDVLEMERRCSVTINTSRTVFKKTRNIGQDLSPIPDGCYWRRREWVGGGRKPATHSAATTVGR